MSPIDAMREADTAITEASRHQLFQRLEEVLGAEEATTLTEHLPPVGRADVATKRDLDRLGARLELKVDNLGDKLRSAWRHDLLVSLLAGNAALAFAAARLV